MQLRLQTICYLLQLAYHLSGSSQPLIQNPRPYIPTGPTSQQNPKSGANLEHGWDLQWSVVIRIMENGNYYNIIGYILWFYI